MDLKGKYEAVIGLEVHAQLLTKTKAYSSDENIYGAIPNTKTSVISLGHPGALPKSNKKGNLKREMSYEWLCIIWNGE